MDRSQRITVITAELTEHGQDAATTGINPRKHPLLWLVSIFLTTTIVVVAVWTLFLVSAVHGARADVTALHSLQSQQITTMSPDALSRAASRFKSLKRNLSEIDRLTTFPPGLRPVVERLPWLGNRYGSTRALVRVGLHLADAGEVGAVLARETLRAYEITGLTVPAPNDQATWLDVLGQRRSDLDRIQSDVDLAVRERNAIDATALPYSLQRELPYIDRMLDRYLNDGLTTRSDLKAVMTALGSDKTMRYLVLFQNPAELRPSGGFPGTMGLVTIDRGQLVSCQIFDGHKLTDAYVAQRTSKRPEPWPIDQYFPQDGFLLHDAGWYADFPKAGATIMSMYAETNWPAIDGVIAVQPAVVADLLQVTGPLDVVIDGDLRHVTAANFYDEIERQRRLIVEGIKPWDKSREVHKEAVASIGEAIMESMKSADRAQFTEALKLLMHSGDVRDIQAYAADPALESAIDRHRWSGRLNPDPVTPAVAITFANVALQKSSEFMHPSLRFSVSAAKDVRQTVTLDITVDNTGPIGENQLYSGFQSWWIQVSLPSDFHRISSNMPSQPDPQAPNGGSYEVGINPQQARQLTVVFSIPANAHFLIRRQPGLSTAKILIDRSDCEGNVQFDLVRDTVVDFTKLCQPRAQSVGAALTVSPVARVNARRSRARA